MIERFASTAGLAMALCVGLIFLTAGISKLRYRTLLPGVVANYRLLPDKAVPIVAVLFPFVELTVGFALVVGERRVSPWLGIGLLLTFAWAMAVNLRRGRKNIDCGCGSPHLRQTLNRALVIRNLVLALSLLIASAAPGSPTGGDLPVAIAAGVALYLMYHLFHALHVLNASGPVLKAQV